LFQIERLNLVIFKWTFQNGRFATKRLKEQNSAQIFLWTFQKLFFVKKLIYIQIYCFCFRVLVHTFLYSKIFPNFYYVIVLIKINQIWF